MDVHIRHHWHWRFHFRTHASIKTPERNGTASRRRQTSSRNEKDAQTDPPTKRTQTDRCPLPLKKNGDNGWISNRRDSWCPRSLPVRLTRWPPWASRAPYQPYSLPSASSTAGRLCSSPGARGSWEKSCWRSSWDRVLEWRRYTCSSGPRGDRMRGSGSNSCLVLRWVLSISRESGKLMIFVLNNKQCISYTFW